MVVEAPFIEDGRIYFQDDLCTDLRSLKPVIEKLIKEIYAELVPEDKYSAQVKYLTRDLHLECKKCLKYDRILGFGSSFNGFRTKQSDVDFVVELKDDGIDQQLIECKEFMEKSHIFRLKEYVRTAQVPIVTVEHIKTGLACDISFSVPSIGRSDVIWNTNLLKSYSNYYPEVTQAFRLLKYVLNFTSYGSVRTKGLSTYGHIILFLYYVTRQCDPIIPLLDVTTLKPDSSLSKPDLSGSEIFIGYLRFLACKLDSSKHYVDIKNSETALREHRRHGMFGRLFIQDPYINKNLGKYMKEQQLFDFKVFCFRLLHYFHGCRPDNLSQLGSWCRNYQNLNAGQRLPPIHPCCGKYNSFGLSYYNSCL